MDSSARFFPRSPQAGDATLEIPRKRGVDREAKPATVGTTAETRTGFKGPKIPRKRGVDSPEKPARVETTPNFGGSQEPGLTRGKRSARVGETDRETGSGADR